MDESLKKLKKFIIYQVVHKESGKIYVGQTRFTLKKRWKQHCAAALSGSSETEFHKAIVVHGKDAFEVSELCSALDESALDELEKAFIKKLNTFAPNGYNMTAGGRTPAFGIKKPDPEFCMLKKLTRFARSNGIVSLHINGISFTLSPAAIFPTADKSTVSDSLPSTPDSPGLTEEEILLWSAPGGYVPSEVN